MGVYACTAGEPGGDAVRAYYPKDATIPKEAYLKAVRLINSYEYNRMEADSKLEQGVSLDGMPKGNLPGDPTGRIASSRDRYLDAMTPVDLAARHLPAIERRILYPYLCRTEPLTKLTGYKMHSPKYWAMLIRIFVENVARYADYV